MQNKTIYFDNAATSWPKPPAVAETMTRFLAKDAANPGRAGHRMAVAAERMINSVRKQLADLVGVTRQTIILIEAGKYNPTLKLCLMIKKVTGKNLDELFG